jgi:hypothetical protein
VINRVDHKPCAQPHPIAKCVTIHLAVCRSLGPDLTDDSPSYDNANF